MPRPGAAIVLLAAMAVGCDAGFDPRDLPNVRRLPGPATVLDRSERLPLTYRPSRDDLDNAVSVDVCDLVRQPAVYDHQVLKVHGFYGRGVEGPFLSGPTCPHEPGVCLSYFDFGHRPTLLDHTVSLQEWTSPFGGDAPVAELKHTRVPEIVLTAAFHEEVGCWSGRSLLLIFRVEEVREASPDDGKALDLSR
jgi:hypothetical protein